MDSDREIVPPNTFLVFESACPIPITASHMVLCNKLSGESRQLQPPQLLHCPNCNERSIVRNYRPINLVLLCNN